MLARMNAETTEAEGVLRRVLDGLSVNIRVRGFDEDGLCQGMPFVWKGLDPGTMPYFFAI